MSVIHISELLMCVCVPQSWRLCYYGVGVVGLVVAFFTFLTLREPPRTTIGEEGTLNQ